MSFFLSFLGEEAQQNLINQGNLYFQGSSSYVLFCSNHQIKASDKEENIKDKL